ncbi:tRNA modification GTPase [Roseiarcus fermentans]|uniref:tRNA modification GTPase MnmE n=1 Tax=Roseiarcus fermentans TaxID=1473586 RepID=A0A366FQH9_9HYPH|nr:tRNA uridine-5-carboxymethylaminomethyl(34) synthesis GTPase MnmE [Roseiarcus fermentans]RBP16396.1 tRNA modification GTPase [Roseiarcus fermentans]
MAGKQSDTIFAQASGVGKAAVAVFRISGPACVAALAALAPGAVFPDRTATLRTLTDPATGEALDRALVIRFAAPRSFTGEEVAEIHVTGGRAVPAALARALAAAPGLRLAAPGEFAWRAFLNGKMDLSEAEGLADLVEAETEAQRRQAVRIAGGALRRECDAIRAALLDAMATVEAQLDFSDVEDADLSEQSVRAAARRALDRIDRGLASARSAERLRTGYVVVIAGPPNVGKSTLLNAIAGRDVAITSPFAGTTRDPIEVAVDLAGYPVVLVDTAGIRDAADPVEQEGVRRARQRAEDADLTLWLDDGLGRSGAPGGALIVRTKSDLAGADAPPSTDGAEFAISAKTGQGIDRLLAAIAERAVDGMATAEPAVLTAARHRDAFAEARSALASILAADTIEAELAAESFRIAAAAMDRVVGRIGVEDVLGAIFSRLCVGK